MGRYSAFYSPQSIVFYIIIFFLYFYGFQRGYRLSREFLRQTKNPEYMYKSPYSKYSPVTFEGLVYDANDGQWRTFRHYIESTAEYLFIYVLLSRIFRYFGHWLHAIFHFLISFYFLKTNHNHYCLPLLSFFLINYITTVYILRGRYRLTILFVWIYAIGSLYFVDSIGRKFFDNLLFSVAPKYTTFVKKYFQRSFTLLHWVVMFDLFLLRMISFSLDYAFYLKNVETKNKKIKERNSDENETPERRKKVWYCDIDRRTFSDDILKLSDYNIIHYFNYVFYPPLYVSGPVMTFNCFVSYYYKPNFPSIKEAVVYLLRFLVSFLCLDVSLHLFFWFNILKTPDFFLQFSGFDWICLVVWTIRVIWLKYNTIWKFFRFFAMIDGFVPYEDVKGCYWNWKDSTTFWKEFHASIRKWTLRYIYFPLGGSRVGNLRKILNVVAVFVFMGYWHDLEWKLMGWAILASLIFIPELLIIRYEKRQGMLIQDIWGGKWMWVKSVYLWLLQFGFMSCVLVGFGIGIERTISFWKMMFTTKEGWVSLFLIWYVFRYGYPLMLEVQKFQNEKEMKRRKEIDEKYRVN